jgi:hypothetical protein
LFFIDLKLISTVFRTCEEVNEEQSSELSLWILVNIVKVKLTSMIEDGRL